MVATYTWTTDASGLWGTSSNWTPAGPPGSASIAVITATGTNYTVTINNGISYAVADVTVKSANATLAVGGTLAASQTLAVTAGLLTVLNGGTVQANNSVTIATSAGSVGTLSVTGNDSLLTTAGGITAGSLGTAQLDALNGGTIALTGSSGITVGTSAGSFGSIEVTGTDAGTGAGALLSFGTTARGITVGDAGQGAITVSDGGTIEMAGTGGVLIGSLAASVGYVAVTGPGSLINMGTHAGAVVVGQGSTNTATLVVTSGGTFDINGTSDIVVGQSTGAVGLLTVSGSGSVLDAGSTGMVIAAAGSGTLEVLSGGAVTIGTPGLSLGDATGVGTVIVSGTGSSITALGANGAIDVGASGTGVLTINTGGNVSAAGGVSIATVSSDSQGTVTVDAGTLTAAGFTVGSTGTGTLTVQDGGVVTNTATSNIDVGFIAGSSGTIVVNGGTLSDTTGGLFLGGTNASGSLLVESGSLITGNSTAFADINASGTGVAAATVSGGTWSSNGQLIVGDTGSGLLTIDGGVVNAGTNSVNIGNQSGGSGTVIVSSGGQLDAGGLSIGNLGTGGGFGTLDVNSGLTVALTGALGIGNGGTLDLAGGTLSAIGLSASSGAVDGFGTLMASLSNAGTVAASGGRLVVTGSIAGVGTDMIDGGATLEVGSGLGLGQSVSFATSGTAAALQLDALSSPTQNFGLANWQTHDELIIGTGVTVTGAQWVGSSSTGTVVVDTSGLTYDFTEVSLGADAFPIFQTGTNFVELISCFAAGTRIRTVRGEVAVEDLVVGDVVPTAIDGTEAPIIWVGHREVDCARHPKPRTVWPVHISAGAFGPGLPLRALTLSPDHAVYVNEVLVPVKLLVNGSTITQVKRDRITYYHLELPQHDVVFADGLPVESYLDVGDRANFANGGSAVRLHIDLAHHWEALGCARLVIAGPELAAARAAVTHSAAKGRQAA